jgi:hypothetical protein
VTKDLEIVVMVYHSGKSWRLPQAECCRANGLIDSTNIHAFTGARLQSGSEALGSIWRLLLNFLMEQRDLCSKGASRLTLGTYFV